MNKTEFKALLKANGLKQTSFAAKTGYSVQGIAKWIKHDAVPVWVEQWFIGYHHKDEDMNAYTKIVIKRGETLVIRDDKIIHHIVADEITIAIPMDWPTCSVTEIVGIQTLAECWLRENKK